MKILSENQILEIDNNHYDKEDVTNLLRLQMQLLTEENQLYSFEECANIWQKYSNDLSASWLCFPKENESILKYIRQSSFFTSFLDYSL